MSRAKGWKQVTELIGEYSKAIVGCDDRNHIELLLVKFLVEYLHAGHEKTSKRKGAKK